MGTALEWGARMRLLLFFHLILFSSFSFSTEASGLSLDGVFQALEKFVTLDEGGLRLKDGIIEAVNQLHLSKYSAQKIVEAAQKLVKEYLSKKGLSNAGDTIDLSSLGSFGIHILLRQAGTGFTAHLTLPGPLRNFKEIAEKLTGSWVPLADDVKLNITVTTSETSEDVHFLTTVTYQSLAELLQIARLSSGEKGNWSSRTNKHGEGTLAVKSTLEGGVWKHAFNISDKHNSALEPDTQFTIEWPTFGWEDPEQIKKIHTSVTQGTKHREIKVSLTGSWSQGFSLDSLQLPCSYDSKGRAWRWGSALISNDNTGRRWNEPGKTWSLQLMKPNQWYNNRVTEIRRLTGGRQVNGTRLRWQAHPYPTHNFTFVIRENGLEVTGEMQSLLVNRILPEYTTQYRSWRVDGGRPYSLFINVTMPTLPESGQILPEGAQPVLVAKIESMNSIGYKKYRDGYPSTFDRPNLLRFNKAMLLIDSIGNKFELRLNNEKHPDNGEFVSKISYEVERSNLPMAWTLKYAFVSHYKTKTQWGPDPKYIEEVEGNYTWTGFEENPDKFRLESREKFTSEYNYDDSISFPLYGLWNLIFENRYARSRGLPWPETGWVGSKIQLDVSRTIVYEKKTKNLLLAFYGNRWEIEGKVLQAEQTVDLDGKPWHKLDYILTSSDEHHHLNMDFFFHNTDQDVWRHNLKYATGFWKNKSRLAQGLAGSEPGFFLEHKIVHGNNSTLEHMLQSMTSFVLFPFYPKSNGLKFDIDFKRNTAKQPGGEISVLEYNGDYVWIADPKTIREKESGLKMKDKISQTEESPFYEASQTIFGEAWKEANILRQVVYNKRIKKLFEFFGIFSFQMGTLEIEYMVELDSQRFSHFKIDTRETPGTIIWYHKPVEGLAPTPRDLLGQDKLLVKVGQFHKLSDLKFETNLPQLQIFNSTSDENTRTVEINGKDILMIEWCEEDSSSSSGMSTQWPISVRMTLPSGNTLDMELSLPSSFHTSSTNSVSSTESTDSVSLGSPTLRNNLTFTVEARLERCEEPDRCSTSEQMIGSLDLAANPPSYLLDWNITCAMMDFCNSFGLPSSQFVEINLDTADPDASKVSYMWRYSPAGNLHGLKIKKGNIDVNL